MAISAIKIKYDIKNATYKEKQLTLMEYWSETIQIAPRTNDTGAFYENMKSAKHIADLDGGNVKADIYRGKNPKPRSTTSI